MKIEILGSGGAVTVPRPGHHDRYNDEARQRGIPYQRRGPSVFIHEANILFDTPEDIVESLNRAGVEEVSACFYSHWHPDHVMGRRVFEQMNWNLRGGESKSTDVYVPEVVQSTMKKTIGTWDHLEFLQSIGVVKLHVIAPGASVTVNDIEITPEPLAEDYVFAYHVRHAGKHAWIAMDELAGWSPTESVQGLDLAILPCGVCELHPLSQERRIPADDPVLTTEIRYERTLECIGQMAPRQAVLMHLDEPDGVTYDDGLELSRQLQSKGLPVTFAWDGYTAEIA